MRDKTTAILPVVWRISHAETPWGGVKTADIPGVRQPLCASIPTLLRNKPTGFLPQPSPLRSQLPDLGVVNRAFISLYLIIYSTAAAICAAAAVCTSTAATLRCGQHPIPVPSLCGTGSQSCTLKNCIY